MRVLLATLGARSCNQPSHHGIQLILRLETDTGPVRQFEKSIFYLGIIRKARKNSEHARIRFAAAQAEAADQVQGHLIAAVRKHVLP